MMSTKSRWVALGLISSIPIAASFGFLAQAAENVPTAEVITLGQSARTGDVCEAVRDWDDPAAQVAGARVWKIRCRGWPGNLGNIYVYRDKDARNNVADGGAWRTSLAERATCEDARPSSIGRLANVKIQSCVSKEGDVPYIAYTGTNNNVVVAGDGYAAISDVVELGLRIVAGTQSAPRNSLVKSNQSVAETKATSLSDITTTASKSPSNLRLQAYLQNQSWFFATSESAFQTLANGTQLTEKERIEAYMNWALQVSNLGRFPQATQLFANVRPRVEGANDNRLLATFLVFEALHARNQRDFATSTRFAQQAVAMRQGAMDVASSEESVEIETGSQGEIRVSKRLSDALNGVGGASGFSRRQLTERERQSIQVAQALQVLGSAQAAQGDTANAITNLSEGRRLLEAPALLRSSVWLKAQVNSELARIYIAQGNYAEGTGLLRESLQLLSRSTSEGGLPGSQAEAATTLEFARALALSGQKSQAIDAYDRGLSMFRDLKGSLAASSSVIEPYFALLINEERTSKSGQERFFRAMQSAVSPATAETVAKLAAQLSSSNSAGSTAARALEDTRIRIRVQQGRVQELQAQGGNNTNLSTAVARLATLEAEERGLTLQLLAANPGYNQFLITTVSVQELQEKLKPGELYYKTVLLNTKGYAIAITSDRVNLFEIPLNKTTAQTAVDGVRRPFDVPRVLANGKTGLSSFNVGAAHNLYEALFSQLGNELNATNHLIFDPDGALSSLPVGILIRDQASVDTFEARRASVISGESTSLTYEGLNWIGRKIASTLAISASSFIQARAFAPSTAGQAFIGFGDAVPAALDNARAYQSVLTSRRSTIVGPENCRAERADIARMSRLPGTSREITQVGDQLGADASQKILGGAFSDGRILARKDLDQFRIVFFGTHTLLPADNSCVSEPALLTSLDDATGDGLLDTSEIATLKLNAELVVLSACNTGGAVRLQDGSQGGIVASGESLGGLARSFIYAGSRGLLVSHWNADDAATRDLMTEAFNNAGPKDESQSNALKRTQVDFMDRPERSHPYFWGAFTLVGDGGRLMKKGT
jgi:CHAT domain-containing protein